jgi:hypothetical protein
MHHIVLVGIKNITDWCPELEQRYSSTISLTSALSGVGWSTPRPGRFTSGKDSIPNV